MDGLRRLRQALRGPPPALPRVLDETVERWWRLPPRARLALGGLVVVAAVTAAGLAATRSPWGEARAVQVAARHLPAGSVVRAGDVRTERWPASLAPSPPPRPVGERLGVGVPAGAALRAGHLARDGPAAGLSAGRVAVALPTDLLGAAAGALGPGQRTDLLAAGVDGTGRVLARGAAILAADGQQVWVAVPRDRAAHLAAAADRGAVTVALVPPGGSG